MQNYYPRRAKLADSQEKRMIRRTIFALGATAVLLIFLFIAGIPALLSLGSFFNIFSEQTTTEATQTNAVLVSPRLDPVESATNSARIAVNGYGQEGTTVELFVNGQSFAKNVIDKNGEFVFANVQLKEGQNTIYAKLISQDGKASAPSQKQQISLDKTPPALEIYSPTDGQSFSGPKEIKITGKSEEDASVSINEAIVIVNQDGSFSYPFTLNAGQTTIKVTATDMAGNQTALQRIVNYQP